MQIPVSRLIVPVKPVLYAGRAGWQNHAAYCSPPGPYHTVGDELQSPKVPRLAFKSQYHSSWNWRMNLAGFGQIVSSDPTGSAPPEREVANTRRKSHDEQSECNVLALRPPALHPKNIAAPSTKPKLYQPPLL